MKKKAKEKSEGLSVQEMHDLLQAGKKMHIRLYKTNACARLARTGVDDFFASNRELRKRIDSFLSSLGIGSSYIDGGACYEFRKEGFAMPGIRCDIQCLNLSSEKKSPEAESFLIKSLERGRLLSFMWLKEGRFNNHISKTPVKSIVFW